MFEDSNINPLVGKTINKIEGAEDYPIDEIKTDMAGLIGQNVYIYICHGSVQVLVNGILHKITVLASADYYVKNDYNEDNTSHIYFK